MSHRLFVYGSLGDERAFDTVTGQKKPWGISARFGGGMDFANRLAAIQPLALVTAV